MSAEKVAKRYAKALFDEVISKDQLEPISKNMDFIAKTIKSSRDLKLFLKSPIVNSEKKANALQQIFGDKVTADSNALINLLVANKREGYLGDVAFYFNELYNEHHGIIEVEITTAVAIDDATEQHVRKVIASKVGGKKLIVKSKIDESIKGGFIVELDNKVYDASVRNKLSNIANELIHN